MSQAHALLHGHEGPFALQDFDLLLSLPKHLAGSALDAGLRTRLFDLPLIGETVPLIQVWHPRLHNDPVHQWLRHTMRGFRGDEISFIRREGAWSSIQSVRYTQSLISIKSVCGMFCRDYHCAYRHYRRIHHEIRDRAGTDIFNASIQYHRLASHPIDPVAGATAPDNVARWLRSMLYLFHWVCARSGLFARVG